MTVFGHARLMDQFAEENNDGEISCRHLVDMISDAVLVHFQDRVIRVNRPSLRLFGAERDEQLVGLSRLDLVPPEQREFVTRRNAEVVANRLRISSAQILVCRLDGSTIPVESHIVPVTQSLTGGTAILELLRDVTQAQGTTSNSNRDEIQVRNILDTAMDGIISMNERQEIVLFNSAAEAIFGWKADQVIGRSIEMLIPGRFHARHRADVEEFGRGVVENRRMGTQRTVMALRATGEEFPIEASISQTVVHSEKIFTVILRDVTEAVRHRQQIEQQSQMLDQVSDSISVVDVDGRITYWNQAASRLFGWSANEALGQKSPDLLYRGDPETYEAMLRQTNVRRSWSGELTKVNRAGETVIVEHRRTVLLNDTGETKGYLCLDIDITARKKRERAANRSQRLESIGTLAGGIAHDLNNVLTPILMGAKLLSSGRGGMDRQGLLDTMAASAQRGADLVKQLLAFAGGIRGDRSPVDLDQLVIETRKLLEHTFPKSIQLETRINFDCPSVLGDSTELSQVLMNLCINARDAMPEGGTLSIKTTSTILSDNANLLNPEAHPGMYAILKVSDTGTGMTSEILDRIFDPFFTTKDIGKGTGLGLATVQGIVKSHGGFINVYSEVGHGTVFSIYLPAIVSQATAGDVPPPKETVRNVAVGLGKTILLVDDEAFILQMTSAALEGNGFRVLTAQDGASAIARFGENHAEISAVVLDMMMPGIDGLQTLDQLKRISPNVITIACSGLRTAQREAEVLQRGANVFLPKPYSEDQLLKVLENLLNPTSR